MSQSSSDVSEQRLQRYQALLEVSGSIARHADPAELFRELAGRLRRAVSFDFISILLYDPEADAMRLHVLESGQPGRAYAGAALTPLESPGGWVWRTQQPLSVPDVAKE